MRARYRDAGNVLGIAPALWDSHFLKACRGEPTARTPVWLMRQAGRYMAEYRAMRSGRSFLELCRDPALAAEATVFARARLDVDAAIIFSDILIALEALGLPPAFTAGGGPFASKADRDPRRRRRAGRSRGGGRRPRLRRRGDPSRRARPAGGHPA